MSKTAVSVLQEYVAKQNKGDLEYTILNHQSESHENEFTYKVKYLSYVAYGTASRKQEAKHRSAKGMLELLAEPYSEETTNNNHEPYKVDSYRLSRAQNASPETTFVNSVGKLNEFCAIRKLKTPEYQVLDTRGPSHAMSFTILCVIGKLEAIGESNTKKQAKHNAAQVMLDQLVRNTSYAVTHDMARKNDHTDHTENCDDLVRQYNLLDLKVEEPSVSVTDAAQKAQKLFPILQSYKGIVKVTNNTNVKDLHEAFKNSIDPSVRLAVRTYIARKSGSPKEVLDHIIKLLDHRVAIEVLSNTQGATIVICSLDSKPAIVDTGVGPNFIEAKEQAITNLLGSIDLLLS